jgi:hypothetical protein
LATHTPLIVRQVAPLSHSASLAQGAVSSAEAFRNVSVVTPLVSVTLSTQTLLVQGPALPQSALLVHEKGTPATSCGK